MLELKGKYCKDCKVFNDDVEEEALSTIYGILDTKEFNGSKIRIMPDCLPINSEILTENGFKFIKDLNEDDKVANFNKETKKISFHKPINIINRPMRENEKIFSFVNKRGYSFEATENHRMALKNNMGEKAKNIESFFMKEHYFNGNGLENPTLKYSDNEIRLICWIVGDGYIHTTFNPKTNSYQIRFGLKKERKINRIIQLLTEENMIFSINKTDKQVSIIVNVDSSKKYIDYVTLNKKFPKDFIFLSKEQSDVFFNELIQVDGDYTNHIKYHNYRINSTDEETINLISAIASINYGLSTITKRKVNSSFKSDTEIFYISLVNEEKLNYSRGGIHNSQFNRIENSQYNDNVVCVETNTGFFIARQNGMTFITGNCHQGKGIVIGFSAPITDAVCPSHVGVDIGCTITTYITDADINKEEFPLIEHRVKKEVPFGFSINEKRVFDMKEFFKFMKKEYNRARASWPEMINDVDLTEKGISNMLNRLGMDEGMFYKSLMSVGSGNHFIEFGDYNGKYAFTVHCGSRNFGVKVCKFWEKIASSNQVDNKILKDGIEHIKKTAKDRRDIPNMIKALKEDLESKTCSNGYVMGDNLKGYLTDMVIAQAYAKFNHYLIGKKIEEILKKINRAKVVEVVQSTHNYIDISGDHMIRKGAIRAYKDEKMVVPFNMRDGLAICVGKSNEDWNCSCAHGAGRKMSRSKAKENLTMEEFESEMSSVYSTSVCKNTIDESPMAYKDSKEIAELITDTCDIIALVRPIINIKATDDTSVETLYGK